MTKGIGHVWVARHDRIDYVRGKGGGICGTSFVLKKDQARRFSKAIAECIRNADKFEKDEIQIDVHWGKKPGPGYLVRIRVV